MFQIILFLEKPLYGRLIRINLFLMVVMGGECQWNPWKIVLARGRELDLDDSGSQQQAQG